MLVSHRERFIYLKTVKTAGTSVEIFLEPHCRDDTRTPTHACAEHVSPAGIVGARGPDVDHHRYYNHMPAERVRAAIGEAIWAGYTKIACIRDPFDKVVSAFWMAHKDDPPAPPSVRDRFLNYVRKGAPPVDRAVYTIDDTPCCDVFFRYETLSADLASFCRSRGLAFEPERLGRYKAQHRPAHLPLVSYYDKETLDIVRRMYAPDFDWFGYPRAPEWTEALI